MRFVLLIVLCAPLLLSSSDISENEIPIDDTTSEEKDEISLNIEENENFENEEILTLEEIYKDSVQAYLEEDWDGCIEGFNEAIRGYKDYKKAVIMCRRDCREMASGSQPIFPYNVEDLHFYEKKVRETLCLMNCNQNYRDSNGAEFLKRLSKDVEKKFVDLAAYEYLQICYFQKNRLQDAANAVYTYLAVHPKHEMSIKNLQYYIAQPNVDRSKIMNLEIEPFVTFYINGVNAYDDERYDVTINNLENSLNFYMKSEEDCRLYCEGHFDQGWLPEFTSSVANHFAYCLKCKHTCSTRMNHVNGEYQVDLLPSHYHYLQFAYFKSGDVKSACAAVSSYLLFNPTDQTMLKNEKYYANLPMVEKNYFTPRQEAIDYVKRQEYEKRLLLSIRNEFRIIGARLNAANKEAEEQAKRKNSKEQVIRE